MSFTAIEPEIDAALETASAEQVVTYAVGRYGDELTLAASFQDCVLIDIAVNVRPDVEILFLDTGYHFAETLAYLEVVRGRYGLRVTMTSPPERECPPCGMPGCCQRRKVDAMDAALQTKQAWLSGLRRADSPQRVRTPVVAWDSRRNLVKFNPIAAWTDLDVATYISEHDLPVHPLAAAGYQSIGCEPATAPVAAGGQPRSGRWPGEDKTECGIHL